MGLTRKAFFAAIVAALVGRKAVRAEDVRQTKESWRKWYSCLSGRVSVNELRRRLGLLPVEGGDGRTLVWIE